MNSFDWSEYQEDPEITKPIVSENPKNSKSDFSWNDYVEETPKNEDDIKQSPSKLKEFGRHAGRTTSRVLETIGGFPGDIVQLAKSIDEKLPHPKFLNQEPSFVAKGLQKAFNKLPTSEQLQNISSSITQGFTDPQSASEQFGDEIASLSTALMFPLKNPGKFTNLVKSVGKSILKSSAIKSSGKVAEAFGAEEGGQLASEVGTMFLMGTLGKNVLQKQISDKFQRARQSIPPGTLIPSQNLLNNTQVLTKDLSKGISTPSKNAVINSLNELEKKSLGGAVEAEDLVQTYHDVNEIMSSKKLYDELSKTERKLLKRRFDQFQNIVRDEIDTYGQYNPTFLSNWKEANKMFSANQESRKISNWVSKKVKNIPEKLAGSILIETLMGYPEVAAGTLLGASAIKTGEFIYRIMLNPKLMKYYTQAIEEIGKENLAGFINTTKNFDNEWNKSISMKNKNAPNQE